MYIVLPQQMIKLVLAYDRKTLNWNHISQWLKTLQHWYHSCILNKRGIQSYQLKKKLNQQTNSKKILSQEKNVVLFRDVL